MKAMKIKALIVTGMVIIFAATGVPGFASVTSGPSDNPDSRFVKENQEIRQDIANISYHRANKKCLKQKLSDDRKSHNRMAIAMDKRDLRRTRADLRREKSYLRADSKHLAMEHREAIRVAQRDVKTDKANLASSQRKTRKGGRNNAQRTATNTSEQGMVTHYQAKLERDRRALDREKSSMKSDFVAIKREIKESANTDQSVGLVCSQRSDNFRNNNWNNGKMNRRK